MPVITRIGKTFPGRVGASLLKAAGLPELVTDDAAAFEALAVKLAKDPAALKKLRGKLAKNRDSGALFDTQTFTRNLESAYRIMWQAWLADEPAKGFAVGKQATSTRRAAGAKKKSTPG